MKKIITTMGVLVLAAVTAGIMVGATASASGTSARAVIQGCQNVEMNDSTAPFPASVTWVPAENGHHIGSYRISGGCGQQLTAELLGIGPDSSGGRCAIIYLHVQRDDGSWSRTTTVHNCVAQPSVRVAGFLPVNHRFYLHCADSDRDPLEGQPCRVRFRF